MCRNIGALSPLNPQTTYKEIRSAALQFTRKISGAVKPSMANEAAFERAAEEVAEAGTGPTFGLAEIAASVQETLKGHGKSPFQVKSA